MKNNEQVVSHWATLIDDFDTSGQDFFSDIEARVQTREVPQVTISRIEFHEHGMLSDKRMYLRLQRDDLIFDVGAAPYGTGFFFSWWLARKTPPLAWLYTLGFVFAWGIFSVTIVDEVGALMAPFPGFVLALVAYALLARSEIAGPEAHFSQAPLVGGLYRRFVNPATYHSEDIVAMYQESIRRAVNEAVDHALKAQGRAALAPEQKRLGPTDFTRASRQEQSSSDSVLDHA